MRFYSFLLGILSVWRITHLLQAEDGPWAVVVRLRRRAGTGSRRIPFILRGRRAPAGSPAATVPASRRAPPSPCGRGVVIR